LRGPHRRADDLNVVRPTLRTDAGGMPAASTDRRRQRGVADERQLTQNPQIGTAER